MRVMSSPDVNAAHALGRWGEERAARHLERRGWTVLARNYRFGRREVDLVVRKGRLVVFVEVKTRAGRGFGSPQDAITGLKRREIEAVATHYLVWASFSIVIGGCSVSSTLRTPGVRAGLSGGSLGLHHLLQRSSGSC
jgi:Holliday junction resolvase-like predicted endonuclease